MAKMAAVAVKVVEKSILNVGIVLERVGLVCLVWVGSDVGRWRVVWFDKE